MRDSDYSLLCLKYCARLSDGVVGDMSKGASLTNKVWIEWR